MKLKKKMYMVWSHEKDGRGQITKQGMVLRRLEGERTYGRMEIENMEAVNIHKETVMMMTNKVHFTSSLENSNIHYNLGSSTYFLH